MASVSLAVRLLEAADLLLSDRERDPAFRRRAISSAYYAVFHAIDKVCADYLTRSASRSSEEYVRVYKALDHASLRNAFAQSPLKKNARISRLGEAIVVLQFERNHADYMPPVPNIFTYDRAVELVNIARETVADIESIKTGHEHSRMLAVSLLFKERKS